MSFLSQEGKIRKTNLNISLSTFLLWEVLESFWEVLRRFLKVFREVVAPVWGSFGEVGGRKTWYNI